MDDERQTYNVGKAAKILGVGRNHLYDEIKAGNFPVIRIGKRVVISKVVVDRMLRDGAFGAQAG